MLVSEFDFDLPPELIAQKPSEQREESRMMVLDRAGGKISHSSFTEFPDYLNIEDVLVLNNTKVFPAKTWGKKEEKEIEFLFLKELQKNTWEVLCRPAKKVRTGDEIVFSKELKGKIIEVQPEGKRLIRFFTEKVLLELYKIGYAPLPPYIKRTKLETDLRNLDINRYQTVFAKTEGSIAAPTAGLHFTPGILKNINTKGVKTLEITLNVGLATFQPVRVDKVEDHIMLEETYTISESVSRSLNTAKKELKPITGVGTTSVRTLESAFQEGRIIPGTRATDLFIFPGFKFNVVDRLLTNFHLPKSTLLMLVSAFAGKELIEEAYREAVKEKYRFFSYGDCMYIL